MTFNVKLAVNITQCYIKK